MWGLDRLSSYSTPTGTPPPRHDSYSPAPRRGYPAPAQPVRPGLNPRSSSLTPLVSPNASTASLPLSARIPNGGPRRRPTGGVPANVPDPIHVLESIMGGPPRTSPATNGGESARISEKPGEVEEDIEFAGLSLHDFVAVKTAERQQPTPVHTYSAQSVEECMCSCLESQVFAHCACR
jgi:hypothetical protein